MRGKEAGYEDGEWEEYQIARCNPAGLEDEVLHERKILIITPLSLEVALVHGLWFLSSEKLHDR